MKDLIQLQKVIFPDLLEEMRTRYTVLYTIELFEPIGRRGIVEHTDLPERYVRNEVSLLEEQGLIKVTTKGMFVTEEGKNVIDDLYEFFRELTGLGHLEDRIKEKTSVNEVIVVAGDSDINPYVKQELGRATVQFLKKKVQSDVTIAVTGGSTMAAVANAMVPFQGIECLFIPARGGIGEIVENQANTIVAKMAEAEKGDYRLLHVPDPLSETLYQSLILEPSIADTLAHLDNASIVLHGISDALVLAKRRKSPQHVIDKLMRHEAVSEAFGYYFNEQGTIVHRTRTIGIHLENLQEIETVITVAGGKMKGRAIASFLRQKKTDVLITDEAAAEEMLLHYLK